MLQCVSNLSGLVVVADVWEAPCLPLLQLISKQKPVSSLFFSLESPVFRIGEVGCPVVDLYGKEVEFPELSRDVSLVIVDGVSDWLSQKGVAVVLRALFRLLQVHGCVVVSVHADLVDQPTLSALFAAASSVFSISASNRVFTLSKRKGGKVVRATEDVIDWKGPQLKPVDVKNESSGPELALEDAGDRKNEILPFLKTEVSGKMIFDVEDMKEGDYEDGADEDPDADLDI